MHGLQANLQTAKDIMLLACKQCVQGHVLSTWPCSAAVKGHHAAAHKGTQLRGITDRVEENVLSSATRLTEAAEVAACAWVKWRFLRWSGMEPEQRCRSPASSMALWVATGGIS